MKKKIVIIGALGYIGTELCKIYSGESWHNSVVAIDSRFISERVSQLRNWNIEFNQGGLLDKNFLKEKLLAAHRAGIKTVLIPNENKKDLTEIPEIIKKSINIIPVSTVDEVLKHALTKTLKPVKWAEIDQASAKKDEVTSRH